MSSCRLDTSESQPAAYVVVALRGRAPPSPPPSPSHTTPSAAHAVGPAQHLPAEAGGSALSSSSSAAGGSSFTAGAALGASGSTPLSGASSLGSGAGTGSGASMYALSSIAPVVGGISRARAGVGKVGLLGGSRAGDGPQGPRFAAAQLAVMWATEAGLQGKPAGGLQGL